MEGSFRQICMWIRVQLSTVQQIIDLRWGKGSTFCKIQIDVASLRQSKDRKEIRTIGWIPGVQNPADGLTKHVVPNDMHPLVKLMKTNKLNLEVQGWTAPIDEKKC